MNAGITVLFFRAPLALLIGVVPLAVFAQEKKFSPVVITAPRADVQPLTATELDETSLAFLRSSTSDTASLLRSVPGVSLYGSGGVSSLPAIHGMADDRVRMLVDGMEITSACANHMNPPLSYIDPANVDSVKVFAGITPVSSGGDSIGGTIEVRSVAPVFAKPGAGPVIEGGVSVFNRSNGNQSGASVGASVASEQLSFTYSGSGSRSGDYTDGNNQKVKSTSFGTENHAAKLAVKGNDNLLTFQFGTQRMPYQDFVNAHIDMVGNQAKFANARYEGRFAWGKFDAKVYWENTSHQMNVRGDKTPGMDMPMNTEGTNAGFSVKAEVNLSSRDTFRIGNELAHFGLDDWWPASPSHSPFRVPVAACVTTNTCSMGPGTLWNVDNGRRARLGTFAEWEARWDKQWTSQLGLRNDIVWMNTGNVTGYQMNPAATGSAAYFDDAVAFNSRDHARKDVNFDLTALVRYEANATRTYEAGYARKTRSPNLYERYLWINRSSMSIRMNSWAGDANGYSGNLDLRPETAHTLSASASWHDAGAKTWEVKATPYYSYVGDYIDADRCPAAASGQAGNACTAANLAKTAGLVNLQFANHDARLYGIDLSGRTKLGDTTAAGSFALSGVLAYVRGKNLDTGDNLYHIMPANARLAVEHEIGNWSSALELQLVARKKDLSLVRDELRTAGYGLVNLRASYSWRQVRIDVGIDNLTNKFYNPPLGGVYWIGDTTGNTPVPGTGRSINTAMIFRF